MLTAVKARVLNVLPSAYCLVSFHFLSSSLPPRRQKPKSHKAVGTRQYTVKNWN